MFFIEDTRLDRTENELDLNVILYRLRLTMPKLTDV